MANANVMTVIGLLTPEQLADEILLRWDNYRNARQSWEREMMELRSYQFATSTRTTEVGINPFHNSTTIPKLSHIAMNLRANYNAHLFGARNWIHFEAANQDETLADKVKVITAYARTKAERKDYEGVLGTCVDDWLYAGAAFAQQRYVKEMGVDSNGDPMLLYQGTVLERIPTEDIVFDVTAASFRDSAKVIRKQYTIGDIARFVNDTSHPEFTHELLEELRTTRNFIRGAGVTSSARGIDWKNEALTKDGFGNMLEYMNTDKVEIHEFYGDMYSMEDGTYRHNHKIVVLDRRKVIYDEPIGSPNGSDYLYFDTPERRPDNLMGMSPLARLVGMQYKLDKLENMRADIFDRIANPIIVEKGDVEFYGTRSAPGGRYVTDEQGDVRYLVPDATILNADFQINNTMQIMEELAGSPRNASGFRTPGEKTKFEVQFLDQAGNRIFRDRVASFERNFIEPILNDMIQLGRMNMGEADLVSTTDDEFNTEEFVSITADELAVSGRLRAKGSKLFAERANALQNIMGILSSPASEFIKMHVSGIKLAKTLEELGDFAEFNMIFPNIAVQEMQETQRLMNQSTSSTAQSDVVDADGEPEPDLEEPDEDSQNIEANQTPIA